MATTRRKLDDLVVGDLDCPKSDVLATIVGSSSFGTLHEEWRSLAIHIGIPDHKIHKLSEDYLLEIRVKTLSQLVNELLLIWKAEKGDQAKVVDLCAALEKCSLTDISQALSREFKGGCSQTEQHFIWQGKLVTLDELLGKDKDSDEEENEQIREPEGTRIIKPHLSPPPQPKYYVPRTLFHIPSYELDPTIFLSQSTSEHVFLFNDITKPELAKLTQHKCPIEFSGDQLHRVTVRFILLECIEDYDRIFKITTKPLHVIQQQDQRYFWIKSSSALEVIRLFLMEPPKDMSEEEMVNRILTTPSPCSISIADSPGMGKTLLLANLAMEIQERCNPFNTIHLLIVLQEFVPQLKLVESSTSALEALSTYCSSNPTAERVLFKMLKKFYQVYLFLDGFDEVLRHKNRIVAFLKNIQELKNFKVIVTTRPHVKTELELIFNQFSFEIHPFLESDQVDFLTRYWVHQHESEDCEVLTLFARQCLSALQSNMSNEEREIAGIPLQCMMLGEVYAEDAKRTARIKFLRPNSVQPITLIQMYKKLMNLKFSRIPEGSSTQNYLTAHVHEAIKLLFPDCIEMFKPILDGYNEVDEMVMYSIGLVECSPITLRFVHRTFAEYLLAEFIVDNLGKHRQCVELLFGEIFGFNGTTGCKDLKYMEGNLLYHKLKYPAIGNFIDMHLKQRPLDELLLDDDLACASFNLHDVCVAVQTCCSNNFESTFKCVTKLLFHYFDVDEDLRNSYFQGLPHIVVLRCKDVRMLELVLDFTNQQFGVDLSYHFKKNVRIVMGIRIPRYTPLHVAVQEGNYNLATWLVQQYGDHVKELKYLLHACVLWSNRDSDPVVQDKFLIIDMLIYINRSWIEERDKYQRTPLLQADIHLDLLQHLVRKGADINAYSSKCGTVLYHSLTGNTNTYTNFVKWAISIGFNQINQRDEDNKTPLMDAIRILGSAAYEVVHVLLEAGAELNAEDNAGESILFHAFEHSGNADLIKILIDRGANVQHKNKRNQNALHKVMQAGKISVEDKLSILDTLVEINHDLVSEKDQDGCTPLLVNSAKFSNHVTDLRLLQRLVEHGADINAHSSKYGTVLHTFCCRRDTHKDLVCWAFSKGFNQVNREDRYFGNPLKFAIKLFGAVDYEVLQLFREAGAELNIQLTDSASDSDDAYFEDMSSSDDEKDE